MAQSHTSRSVLVPSPLLRSLRAMAWMFLVGAVFCLALAPLGWIDSFSGPSGFLPVSLWASIVLGIAFGACAALFFVQIRYLKHLEHRRYRAVESTGKEAGNVPSTLTSPDLVFPPTISLRMRGCVLFFWAVGASIVFAFLEERLLPLRSSQDIFIGVEVLFIFLLATVVFLLSRTTLQATKEGLTVTVGTGILSSEHALDWREACLFACYRGLWGSRRVIYYELSSASTMVTWAWHRHPSPVFSIWRPVIPNEEYQRRMQVLVELVSAKTGLLLYDLSGPR